MTRRWSGISQATTKGKHRIMCRSSFPTGTTKSFTLNVWLIRQAGLIEVTPESRQRMLGGVNGLGYLGLLKTWGDLFGFKSYGLSSAVGSGHWEAELIWADLVEDNFVTIIASSDLTAEEVEHIDGLLCMLKKRFYVSTTSFNSICYCLKYH